MAHLAADRTDPWLIRLFDAYAYVWDQPIAIRLRGGVSAMAGVGLALAIATSQATDPSLNVSSADRAHNLLGGLGATIADLALQSVGLAGLCLAATLMAAGVAQAGLRDVVQDAPRVRRRFWLGVAGSLLLAAALAGPQPPKIWPLPVGLGGLWGDGLCGLVSWGLAQIGAPWSRGLAGALFALAAAFTLYRASGAGVKELVRLGQDLAGLGDLIRQSASRTAARERGGSRDEPNAPAAARAPRPKRDKAATGELKTGVADVLSDAASDAPPFDLVPPAVSTPQVASPKSLKTSSREIRENQATFEFVAPNGFRLPELSMLAKPKARMSSIDEEALRQNARLLETVLFEFGVKGHIDQIRPGPVVTLYEFSPAPGVKHSRVVALSDDIARSMSARACRVSVVQGRNAIGVELPNPRRDTVYLRDLLASADYEKTTSALPVALGETIGGEPYVADLARMPHLLIAGTTGSGKSVGVNAMILSILYRLSPDQCRFIMIDPKMLELSVYDGIPHLLAPVVTDPKKAIVALKWTVKEMEDRYRRMSKIGVRNIGGFNEKAREALARSEHFERTVQTGFDEQGKPVYETETVRPEPMPYLVVVIDEVADLMMVAGKDIEGAVQRLAQMARAAGIHLIMATQRPSVDVITGTIKANFPTRISFQVTSKIDARTILGEQGAEQLLGQGDMLYMAGGGRITRLHGPFVSDAEVEEVATFLRRQGEPTYLEDITAGADEDGEGGADDGGLGGGSGDDLYDQAVAVVTRDRKASTSYIQRRLQIGYNRAASLIERMEQEGVVSPANHAGKRDILAGPPP